MADRGPGRAAGGCPQVSPRGGCSRQERPSGAGSQAAASGDGGLEEGRAEPAAAGPVGPGLGSCLPPPLPACPGPPSQPRPEWLEPCSLPDLTVASSWTPSHFLCSGHFFSPSSLRPDTAHSPGAAPSEHRAGGQGVPQARGPDLPPQGVPVPRPTFTGFLQLPLYLSPDLLLPWNLSPWTPAGSPYPCPRQAQCRVLPHAFGLSPLQVCTARVPVPPSTQHMFSSFTPPAPAGDARTCRRSLDSGSRNWWRRPRRTTGRP